MVARWANGVAARELGRLEEAANSLRTAIAQANDLALASRAAQIRDSYALTLFLSGENEAALAQTTLAEPHLRGRDLARLRMQRGLLLQRLGRLDDALVEFRRALAGMRRVDDRLGETRLRINRAVIHTYRNDLSAASTDLTRARSLSRDLGQSMLGAMCAHNLGFNEGRAGRVPEALEWFETARSEYRGLGVEAGHLAVLDIDQAELLLWAGGWEEAVAMADRAASIMADQGATADLAEAYLLAARAALASEDSDGARRRARESISLFRTHGRLSWQTLAEYVDLQATFAQLTATNRPRKRDLERTRRGADRLASALAHHGWQTEASHARTIAARCAIALDDAPGAHAILSEAASARRHGPVMLRTRAWHATALLRRLDGNLTGSARAIEAGLRLVDDFSATLGAAELRASATRHAQDLVDLAIGLALERDRTDDLFAWIDRSKAGAIAAHPVQPPDSPALAAALQDLRHIESQLQQSILAGAPDRQLSRAQSDTESRIRTIVRGLRGSSHHSGHVTAGVAHAVADGDTIVNYFTHRGTLRAVVLEPHGSRLVDLGTTENLDAIIGTARADLHRLARGAGSDMSLDAARASLEDTGMTLQRRLLEPVGLESTAGLVVLPAGPLHGLPWRILPRLTDAAFSIAPSAAAWCDARSRVKRPPERVVFAAGPDLPGAVPEVKALRRRYANATQLTGRNATVARVLAGMEDCDLAHIACHGTFRADNPMFSALRLTDGSLTVYDMERLRSVPDTVILPACDAAVVGMRPGDELLGLSAALVGMGVRSLVLPQVPIPDAETTRLMRALHQELRAHAPAPAALAAAIKACDDDTARSYALRRAFIAMGA